MELVQCYNKINELLNETEEQRKSFESSIENVEDSEEFETLIIQVLDCFSNPYSEYNSLKSRYISIGEYNLGKIGLVALRFSKSKHYDLYYSLKETTKEILTSIINKYSPVELEVHEIFISEYDATIMVTLKGLKIN